MISSVAGSRYARALAEIVFAMQPPVKPEDVVAQLRSVEELIADSPELRAILQTPAVQTSRKREVIAKLAQQLGVANFTRNFVFVLLDHKRIDKLSEIRAAFENLIDEHLGFVRAEVTSAGALDPEQASALQAELNVLSGKQVRMNISIDPDLLGGVAARIGSTVYDGSVRGRLEGLRRKLASESVESKAEV